ncbi:MAG: response regulator transcription factor [Actinobacteria bacterium]|nr:response regulator transcription factor [Actinomycetota bacterium]
MRVWDRPSAASTCAAQAQLLETGVLDASLDEAPVEILQAVRDPGEPRVRVLIAEDDERVRGALGQMLETLGFCVIGRVGDGEEAFQLACCLCPDVVLMDLRMPVMDGITATKLIRSRDPRVQVVMNSAYKDEGLEQEARQSGAAGYLEKGAAPWQILSTLISASRSRLD